ncbi:MAG: BrnT family toxin [Caulobacteraceae bacterium]
MQFEWDPAKARRNLAFHGVDFEDARRAVLDPFRIEVVDDRFDYGEERIQIIGVCHGDVLFVVTVFRHEHLCRIISARPATRAESQRYFTHDQD